MSGPDAEPLDPMADEAVPRTEGKDEPEVSQSLVGLMGAFDQLREAVGYSVQDSAEFAAIERFVQDIEAENVQLRLHAVEAIEVAERMREENSALVEELTASRVGTMVEQAAELDRATREYDAELMQARVEEAEAVLEEVTELRTKVAELEEENTGLTEMLNELRQSQQQLSRLQLMEATGTSDFAAVEAAEAAISSRGLTTPAPAAAPAADEDEGASPPYKTPVEATPETTPPPSAALNGTPAAAILATPGSTAKDPEAVAEALSAVAGGSEGGVAAAAARMLRDYAGLQATLESERVSKAQLQEEVDRLNEITSAKTFKAPSAWAEREVKYRQEKQQWQEAQKDTERRLAAMREELDALRGTSGAAALERRMEELEARLLESERDRDAARSALHEMEIASKARSGEFSLTGVKPYSGPRMGEEGEVQQVVATLESSGGNTPGRPSPMTPAVGWVGESATPRGDEPPTGDLHQQLAALKRENVRLKATLEKAGLGAAALETPQVVRDALSSSTVKKAKDLESQLATTQQERAALLAELEELKAAAAARGAEEAQRVTLQLRVAETETRTEVALLQRGVDSDSARELAALAAQLREAQRREAAALAKVDALKAEAEVPATEAEDANDDDEDALPPASAFQAAFERQQKEAAAEDEVAAAKEEQDKIQEEMQRVASTAVVVPELLHAPVVAPGEEEAESVPEEIAPLLEEAAAAAVAAAPAPAAAEEGEDVAAPAEKQEGLTVEAVDRIQALQTQLRAAEAALAALEKGAVPVQMHISVAEVKQTQEAAAAPAAEPVQMRISVTEGPTVTSVKLPITLASGEEAVASIHMPININAPPSPVRMAINVNEAAPGVAAAPTAAPVQMAINLAEAPAPAVHMPISVAEAAEGTAQVPISVTGAAEGTVQMPIAVASDAAPATPINLAINVADAAESVTRISMPISVAGDAPKASPRVTMPISVAGDASTVSMPINVAGDAPKASPHVTMPINVAGDAPKTSPRVTLPINVVGDAAKASPRVHMSINVAGDAPAPVHIPISVPDEPVTRVELPISVTDAAAPVRIPITIAEDPAKERRMRQLEALLQAANEEEERLRRDLESLAPVRLNFNVGAGGAAGASPPATGMSRRSSAGSMEYSSEGLARDRAAAEAAYQDHVKAHTDVAALLRSKAELETQVQMLQAQLEKAQGALSAADEEQQKIQESIDDALTRGDVGMLAGLKEGLLGSKARLGGRSFKVFGKRNKDKDKGGPTDQDIKTALHDTQDALTEAEAERNALRRQLARMTKKMEKKPGGAEGEATAAAATGVAAGVAAAAAGVEAAGASEGEQGDVDVVIAAMRDENDMLMEHLVSTKVRLAEVEGDFLESRRALLRSREKQMQLARQIMELQAAELADMAPK